MPISLANDGVDAAVGAGAGSISKVIARASDYLALTKPRVMSLEVFNAVVGLLAAPGHVGPVVGVAVILRIALGAGAAGALNMWYDVDVDASMSRTAARPIPRGRVSPAAALALGLLTSAVSVIALAWLTNVAAAGLLSG